MSSPWRSFPSHVEDLAKRFHGEVFSDEPFASDGGAALGGGTSAVRVTMACGLKAWAKPARINPSDAPAPAHEKIAADLGYLLGLPIPPVILSRKTEGTIFPAIVSLSYEALPQGRPWATLGNALTPETKTELLPLFSAMWAFNAWVNDTDHSWNAANVIIEIQPDGAIGGAFIDYSNSLTYQWSPPAPPAPQDWGIRSAEYNPRDNVAILDAVSRIEKLSSTDFGSIIKRVPSECLSEDLKDRLFEGLDARRGQLRTLLNLEGAT